MKGTLAVKGEQRTSLTQALHFTKILKFGLWTLSPNEAGYSRKRFCDKTERRYLPSKWKHLNMLLTTVAFLFFNNKHIEG